VGDVPFYRKFALKVAHPFKNADFEEYLLIEEEESAMI